MASVSLIESAKISQDEMVAGIIEEIITTNEMYQFLPFDEIDGNSLKYQREKTLGGVGVTGVGTTIADADLNPIPGETAGPKAPATFTEVYSGLTTILGDAPVNGMIQATRSGVNDQTATQIASKAKHCGRVYQHMMINGDGSGDTFEGLAVLCADSQIIPSATHGSPLTLELMDELADMVLAKDGKVDYYAVAKRTRREYRKLLRALGGASIMETMDLPGGGGTVASYNGIPVFANDYIYINGTQGNATNATQVFCGTFDDGSRSNGVAGLTAREASGIVVVDVGEAENSDDRIWRVKWYPGLALFSEKALSMATGIIPPA